MGIMYREEMAKQDLASDLTPNVEFVHLPPWAPGFVPSATDTWKGGSS